jgi:hypothetical protein
MHVIIRATVLCCAFTFATKSQMFQKKSQKQSQMLQKKSQLKCLDNAHACHQHRVRFNLRHVPWFLVLGKHEWKPFFSRASSSGTVLFTVAQDDDNVTELASFVLENHGIVIPMYEEQYAFLAHQHNPAIAAPPLNVFQTFEGSKTGKRNTMEWFNEHHLASLTIREWSSTNDVDRFPIYVKKTTGTYGEHMFIAYNRRQMMNSIKELKGESYILQEAIKNIHEWGIYFSAYLGQVLYYYCQQFTFEQELFIRKADHGTGMVKSETRDCSECPLERSVLQNITSQTGYHGFGTLGLKQRLDGTYSIIEINTRLGGSNVVDSGQLIRTVQSFWSKHNDIIYTAAGRT